MNSNKLRQNGHLNASIEATAQSIIDAPGLEVLFAPGTSVYLPALGTENVETVARAASRIIKCGYEAVPHIAVRRIVSETAIESQLALLASCGVENCLLIAGDASLQGPYASTLSLLNSGLLDRFGFRKIGVAGHPEGNPVNASEPDMSVLQAKARFANTSDADFRIVTQFGFDANTFSDWAESLPELGISLPVHMGIVGPCSLLTLARYAAACGVGNSVRFLKKTPGKVAALARSYDPESLASVFEQRVATYPKSPVCKLHVFPFGGLRKSTDWLYERRSWAKQNIQRVPSGEHLISRQPTR